MYSIHCHGYYSRGTILSGSFLFALLSLIFRVHVHVYTTEDVFLLGSISLQASDTGWWYTTHGSFVPFPWVLADDIATSKYILRT